MLLTELRTLINMKLAGERLSYPEMRPLLDEVIDDINQELNTIYPAFSELPNDADKYQYFPERYMRSVVVVGVAHKFYVQDEEGVSNASEFEARYIKNLFLFCRDYRSSVPDEYKESTNAGKISAPTMIGRDTYGVSADFEDGVLP